MSSQDTELYKNNYRQVGSRACRSAKLLEDRWHALSSPSVRHTIRFVTKRLIIVHAMGNQSYESAFICPSVFNDSRHVYEVDSTMS